MAFFRASYIGVHPPSIDMVTSEISMSCLLSFASSSFGKEAVVEDLFAVLCFCCCSYGSALCPPSNMKIDRHIELRVLLFVLAASAVPMGL